MPATHARGAAGQALPPILMHGDLVKVPTAEGMREWKRLRRSMIPVAADQLIYAERFLGTYWEPRSAIPFGGVQ